eukprot:CAMPEP_0119542992 /NCGR_PEP_ID=MMETSP1344-20130328/53889_1 /TAXON_ID=236787 /ORGANISM="Florenciella parvula, Strain CCMP2471" /LENGTH=155 /DNA_ID=CAMNT_0007587263 /DNA_START=372 /DNA_END=836 /DNA_ORIENTATION=-
MHVRSRVRSRSNLRGVEGAPRPAGWWASGRQALAARAQRQGRWGIIMVAGGERAAPEGGHVEGGQVEGGQVEGGQTKSVRWDELRHTAGHTRRERADEGREGHEDQRQAGAGSQGAAARPVGMTSRRRAIHVWFVRSVLAAVCARGVGAGVGVGG